MSKNNFYLTTTLPYVNAKPHIGFALEIVQADTLARYQRTLGKNVFFNFGTDEHGKKIYDKALEENKKPQDYADEYAREFDALKKGLNLSYDNFIRTTDKHHKEAAQEIWRRCDKNGFIKKGVYKAKYCVGCELEKTDSELVNGRCPLHPNQDIELIEEENYFFLFSKLREKLLSLYKETPDFVVPQNRLKEIQNFVEAGLQDFSISRLKEKMPWGVEVPGDSEHVMYVWFDALTNYISTLGWPNDEKRFKRFWGTQEVPNALQLAGTDNLRQQSAMWQAMLLAAKLPTSKQIFIHGFITVDGQKMSKSLGNVIDPFEYVEMYGTDAVRYFLLAKLHPFDDSDFTKEKFETAYNADLANGLGNLVARVAQLCKIYDLKVPKDSDFKFHHEISEHLETYRFDLALSSLFERIQGQDKKINRHKLWEKSEGKRKHLIDVVMEIRQIAFDLSPFLPKTAKEIEKRFSGTEVETGDPLFPRLD